MKTQYKFSPIALFKITAATDESTPPDKPKITFSSLILDLNSLIVLSTNELGVQDCFIFEILIKKLIKSFFHQLNDKPLGEIEYRRCFHY